MTDYTKKEDRDKLLAGWVMEENPTVRAIRDACGTLEKRNAELQREVQYQCERAQMGDFKMGILEREMGILERERDEAVEHADCFDALQDLLRTKCERIEAAERERDAADALRAFNAELAVKNYERIAALEKALAALCDKLDVIVASPEYQGQVSMAYAHGYIYAGPTWVEELLAARTALEGKS